MARLVADVSVVVVTYRSRATIGSCLESLDEPKPQSVTVVDNASDDGTASFVAERFPAVRVVELPANVGFGAAANVGIETAGTPYVVLLNPDARPVGDALATLTRCAASRADAAVVAPALVGDDGREQPSRVGYPSPFWTGGAAVTSFAARRSRYGSEGFAVGAALLLDTRAFRDVGGFDPDFFLFYEEVDLCLRLEQAGRSIASCPDAVFRHAGGASTRLDWTESYRRQLAGHLRFVRKHRGPDAAERSRKVLVAAVGVRALVERGQRRAAARAALPWLRGGGVAELLRN
jgi:hypothetical protein